MDAKYRDLWETSMPRDMLYQLAIYAFSKNTGVPQSTILYPTLAAGAAEVTRGGGPVGWLGPPPLVMMLVWGTPRSSARIASR